MAVNQIQNIQAIIDGTQFSLQACQYVNNMHELLSNPVSNIVVTNLPLEITQTDVKQIFGEFGKVLTLTMKKNDKGSSFIACILYSKKEEAEAAIKGAD